MMIYSNDTHSNVRYGTKTESLYDRILDTLDENDCVVRRNVEEYEELITRRYDNGELTRDEYIDLTSILEMLATDEYISKCNRKDNKKSKKLPDKKVKQRALKPHDVEERSLDPSVTR